MRKLVALFALLISAGAATAQTAEPKLWVSKTLPVTFKLPPGWSESEAGNGAKPAIFSKAPDKPGKRDGGYCVFNRFNTPPDKPGETPATQEMINRGTAPLPLYAWVKIMAGLKMENITWLDSRPTFLVDGMAAVNARGATDKNDTRFLVHVAQVMSPTYIYVFSCMFDTNVPPFQEPPGFRAKTLAEFETILRTLRVTTP